MKRKVTKAVITAAGYGTRFLPATKNVPKELLPVIDMPVLEYVTQECVDAGIKDIIIVTRYGNNAIEDYFDSSKELESILEEKGKTELLQKVRNVYEKANFVFVRQSRNLPYGTATPLYVIKNLIGKDEAFAYLYGDDIFFNGGSTSAIKELIDVYEQVEWCDGVVGGKKIRDEDAHKYGVFKYHMKENFKVIDDLVEKPKDLTEFAGQDFLVRPGRFIYNAKFLDYIDLDAYKTNPRHELEIDDVDRKFRKDSHTMILHELKPEWYPTGQPIDMIKSTLRLALTRKDLKEEVKNFMLELLKQTDHRL